MPKERSRYSIEIKDATGRSVWFAAADWTDEERRIAIAQNSRLCGMPDENCFTEAKRDAAYTPGPWTRLSMRGGVPLVGK
jgi:hypothetical protein